MKKIIIPLIVTTSLFLTGCEDFNGLQEEILGYNQKVNMSLTSHEDTLLVAKPLEKEIKQALKSKDSFNIQNLALPRMSSDKFKVLEESLITLQNKLRAYIDLSNNMETVSFQNVLASEKLDISEIVGTSITLHYFLDNSNGVVEQMFLTQLPNGYTSSISIYWYGGVIVDVKTYNV